MKIINIKNDLGYLKEYVSLCYLEWSSKKMELSSYMDYKINQILNTDKFISILGLVCDDKLLGFISLFKFDGDERCDLIPWYATMFVKKEYRGKGYSKVLNKAILLEAKKLGYDKVYLKMSLVNYYEKFGAKYMTRLEDGESLYYIDLV